MALALSEILRMDKNAFIAIQKIRRISAISGLLSSAFSLAWVSVESESILTWLPTVLTLKVLIKYLHKFELLITNYLFDDVVLFHAVAIFAFKFWFDSKT